MKMDLERQIENIDTMMDRILRENPDDLKKIVNEIMLGIYDLPESASLKEKIVLASNRLVVFTLTDLYKYLEILGDYDSHHTVIEKHLQQLVKLKKISFTTNEQGIATYRLINKK